MARQALTIGLCPLEAFAERLVASTREPVRLVPGSGLDGSSFDVEAIVWRVDRDGLAFCFTNDHQRRLGTLLAQLAGAPAASWTSSLN